MVLICYDRGVNYALLREWYSITPVAKNCALPSTCIPDHAILTSVGFSQAHQTKQRQQANRWNARLWSSLNISNSFMHSAPDGLLEMDISLRWNGISELTLPLYSETSCSGPTQLSWAPDFCSIRTNWAMLLHRVLPDHLKIHSYSRYLKMHHITHNYISRYVWDMI